MKENLSLFSLKDGHEGEKQTNKKKTKIVCEAGHEVLYPSVLPVDMNLFDFNIVDPSEDRQKDTRTERQVH